MTRRDISREVVRRAPVKAGDPDAKTDIMLSKTLGPGEELASAETMAKMRGISLKDAKQIEELGKVPMSKHNLKTEE